MAWKTFKARKDNDEVQVLIEESFLDGTPNPEQPFLISFEVPFRMKEAKGLCHPDEKKRLDEIEKALLDSFLKGRPGWASYVAQVTFKGMRDYCFYVKGPEGVEKLYGALAKRFKDYDFGGECRLDSGWERLREILELADA